MFIKKKLLVTLATVFLLSATVFSGCGSNESKKDTPSDAPKASEAPSSANTQKAVDPANIKGSVTHYVLNAEDKTYIKKLIPDFNKKYPNIKVDTLEVPYETFDTKLQTLVASGSPPDVTSHYGDAGFIEYMDKGMITDLNSLMEKSKFNAEEIGIPENLMKIYNIGGKQYGIPVSSYVSLLAYNKDMFDKAKVAYPPSDYEDKSWTFDKMVDIAKKLTHESKNIAEAQYGLDWKWSERDMRPLYFGVKTYSDDTWTNKGQPTKCFFDSPEFIKATQRINDLMYVDKVSANVATQAGLAGGGGNGSSTAGDAFVVGKMGMVVDGAWEIATAKDFPFKVGVAAIPVGPNEKVRSVLFVDPLMIFKDSKNQEAAFEWIKFLVSKESQEKAVEWCLNPPANKYAFEKYYNAIPGVDPAEMKNVFEGAIKYGTESYNHLIANYAQINDIVKNEFQPMENNNEPAEKICKSIQKKVSDLLEKEAKK